ncbi:MogA/MoaB family molybdenum cofactor biosynthesis protein [Haloglomus litoreum]|uniref:MogA/MoaB family molybdenum cofactor biosynthesis protein n=1 Tax=Haloglomus litoreum TaxID=3034026 RepID=UPI0023E7DD11|nr:MogA/MoaB family molybdenum cofactor biosynthesis protein [Haloglomus sp. DT116]
MSDDGHNHDHAHEEEPDPHDHDHSHDHDHGGHSHHAHDVETISAGVVTVSSTRSVKDDPAGDAIVKAFEDGGHEVEVRELVNDDLDGIQSTVDRLVARDDVNTVVTTGGTGVTPDDVTIDAVRPVLRTELPGFGELFRRLSYEEVGTRVVGTRALAGIARGVPVFCLPGSENAARLGAEEIIVPEAPHLAGLADRGADRETAAAADADAEGSGPESDGE